LKKLPIAVIVVAAAAIAGVLVLSARQPERTSPVEGPPTRAAVDGGDGASTTTDGINPTRETLADASGVGRTDVDPGVVGRDRIEELENRVGQYIGQVQGLRLTSINSVDCDETQCEIVFTGTDANPQYVDQYMKFEQDLWRQVSDDGFVEFLTGGLSTREVAAGAKEYVMGFTYVAIDPPSSDSYETARQHAACAGAWLVRADEAQSRNLDDTAREAREMVEREFAIAAPVLGRAEAERIAHVRARGPLLRECASARMFIGDRSR
jgi:hypothetical protein